MEKTRDLPKVLLGVHALIAREGEVPEILILQRSQQHSRFEAGRWELPGGKIEPASQSLLEDVEREAEQETAIQIEVDQMLAFKERRIPETDELYPGCRHFLFFYLYRVASPTEIEKLHLSDEHDEFRWVTFADLEGLEFMPCQEEVIRQALMEL